MKKIFSIIVFLFSVSTAFPQSDSVLIICPSQTVFNAKFPIVIRCFKDGKPNYNTESLKLIFSGATVSDSVVQVVKGTGSLTPVISATSDFVISVEGYDCLKNVSVFDSTPTELSGVVYNFDSYLDGGFYSISSDITIASSATMYINPGAHFLIYENVNIYVEGKMVSFGTIENPVVFQGNEIDKNWGGIEFSSLLDTSFFDYSFFTGGGGDTSRVFGHSNSQPLIKLTNGNVAVNNCFIIDNAGKAFGITSSILNLKNSLLSRCDTGGEFHFSKVLVDSCHVLGIPDDDGIISDDDNDGFYFYEVHSSGLSSSVKNSFFVTGEDDGIDHNGAKLLVENCWIQDFYHEGIACSNYNSLSATNTMIRDCGQGIEAGYGSPAVTINHCVFLNNENGVRFGDDYPQASEGNFKIKNSVFSGNTEDILNYDPQLGGPVDDSLYVSYSLTNDADFYLVNNNISGFPDFTFDFLLQSGTTGTAASDDGLDMGLVNSLTQISEIDNHSALSIFPNPANDFCRISFLSKETGKGIILIKNISGSDFVNDQISVNTGQNIAEIDTENLPSGLYFLMIITDKISWSEKLVICE